MLAGGGRCRDLFFAFVFAALTMGAGSLIGG